jgi:hypothetical protein
MESITAKGDTQRAGSVNDSLDRDVRSLFTGYWLLPNFPSEPMASRL